MYLSLCLIAKDENSYLAEWLDYHILLGVEHFWIYDNESAVPLADTLAPYIISGWVTVNTIKGRPVQMFAYDHCIQTYGPESKWIGFIDTDEFIVLHSPELLTAFLQPFEPYGGLAISSLFFSDGGNRSRPKGGQIAGYRIRTPVDFHKNRLVKMIVQPDKVIFPRDPHSFLFKDDFYCVNEKKRRVDVQQYPCNVDTIQVNHYFTRSQQEWKSKMIRGGGAGITYADHRWMEIKKYATVEDTRILDHLKSSLHDAPKDPAAWEKTIHPNSERLTNLLHQAAGKMSPPHFKKFISTEVLPRPEHAVYFNESKMGLELVESKKFNEARDHYASQISRFPNDIAGYTNFAVACFLQGDFQSAWPALAQAWRVAPQSVCVLNAMTDYHYALGDYDRTEKTSLLSASQGDLTLQGLAVLALSQWKQGKIQEALATAQPRLGLLVENKALNPVINELVNLIRDKESR